MDTLTQYRGLENELRAQGFHKIVARSNWQAPQEYFALDREDALDIRLDLRNEQYLVELYYPGEW